MATFVIACNVLEFFHLFYQINLLFLEYTQVKNYGPFPAGKHRKSLERGSSIPTEKFSDFFR